MNSAEETKAFLLCLALGQHKTQSTWETGMANEIGHIRGVKLEQRVQATGRHADRHGRPQRAGVLTYSLKQKETDKEGRRVKRGWRGEEVTPQDAVASSQSELLLLLLRLSLPLVKIVVDTQLRQFQLECAHFPPFSLHAERSQASTQRGKRRLDPLEAQPQQQQWQQQQGATQQQQK